MDADYEAVLASYYRCEDAGGFFDAFYDILFSKADEIPPMFADTDMEMQKQIMMASVLMCLRLRSGDAIARRTIESIGESHSHKNLNVRPELYLLWLDSLCESIQRTDPQFSLGLEKQWRAAMQAGIDLIRSKY